MPVWVWFTAIAVLAVALFWALATGLGWLALLAGVLLVLVLAAMGWAVWQAWLSLRQGG